MKEFFALADVRVIPYDEEYVIFVLIKDFSLSTESEIELQSKGKSHGREKSIT